ncbi:MAG: hypothetical protein PHO58_05060 [Bacilli bacterium]|nr:hypothetical protein [Bacilli bacterium]
MAIIVLVAMFCNVLDGKCQNGYNVPLDEGLTYAEFYPNAIGVYELNYSVTGFFSWDLTVRVYWQSNTYPGWKEFYVRTFKSPANSASDSVVLRSDTNDNVSYRVEFWTNSSTAIGNWTFS